MPIEVDSEIRIFTQDEFQTLERNGRMMGQNNKANRLQELSRFPGFECGVTNLRSFSLNGFPQLNRRVRYAETPALLYTFEKINLLSTP